MAGADVLMGKAGSVPYDMQTRQVSLARRRKMVEAYLAQSLQSGQPSFMNQGGYATPNFLGPLQQVLAKYQAEKEGKQLDEDEAAVAGEYNSRVGAATKQYLDTRDGGVNIESQGPPTEDGTFPPSAGQTKGNVRAAIANALATGLGPLKEMAAADLSNINKQGIGLQPKDVVSNANHFTPDSVAAFLATGDQTKLVAKRDIKDVPANGYVDLSAAQGGTGPAAPVPNSAPKFEEVVTSPTGAMTQKNATTGKVEGITSGNVTPAAGKTLRQQLEDGDAATVLEGYKTGQQTVSTLKAMGQMQALMNTAPDQAFGPAGPLLSFFNRLGQQAGMPPIPGGGDIEKMSQLMGGVLLANARALAPVTKEDVDRLKEILGSSNNSREGLMAGIQFIMAKGADSLSAHNSMIDKISQQPGGEGASKYRLEFTSAPPTGGAPAGGGRLRFDAQGNPI